MSKRKRAADLPVVAKPAAVGALPKADVKPTNGPGKVPRFDTPSRLSRRTIVAAAAGVAALILVVTGLLVIKRDTGGLLPPLPSATAATSANTPVPPGRLGGVYNCRTIPKFAKDLGFTTSALLDTSESTLNVRGLVLVDQTGASGQPRTYQHPSWADAGYLGPIVGDQANNIYVIPVPRINVYDNPIGKQNRIYKVDATTGQMSEFLELPQPRPSNQSNPYGALGLAYDCETNVLYVSSIAGSSRTEESGRIYRVDLGQSKPAVSDILPDVDAFGLAVVNTPTAKRLFYGRTRSSEVWSVQLTQRGEFFGKPRKEFSLSGAYGDGDDKIRRISIASNNDMQLRGIEFSYNLVAARDKSETIYTFRYNSKSDTWDFLNAQTQGKLPS